MTTTPELLKRTPLEAVYKMINDANSTRLDQQWVLCSPPTPVPGEGRRTEVTFSARDVGFALPEGVDTFINSCNFRYNRLDLNTLFEGVTIRLHLAPPTTTKAVVELLFRELGWLWDEDDFIWEDIPLGAGDPYVLKAGLNSYRWVGWVALPLTYAVDN